MLSIADAVNAVPAKQLR